MHKLFLPDPMRPLSALWALFPHGSSEPTGPKEVRIQFMGAQDWPPRSSWKTASNALWSASRNDTAGIFIGHRRLVTVHHAHGRAAICSSGGRTPRAHHHGPGHHDPLFGQRPRRLSMLSWLPPPTASP